MRWYDYDGDNCADIDEAPLQANFITDSVVIPDGVTGNIGLICDGYIDIPADGIYSFYTYSDDGSTLAIDGRTVVDQRRSALPHRTQRTGRPAARRALLLAALLRHQRRHTGGRNHRLRRPAHPVFEPDAETLRQNRFPKPHARTRSLTAAKGKRSARQAVPQRRLLTLRKIQFTRRCNVLQRG